MCVVHCSIALLQEHESWTVINKCKTRILMCSFALNRKIMVLIKLLKTLLGFLNGEKGSQILLLSLKRLDIICKMELR